MNYEKIVPEPNSTIFVLKLKTVWFGIFEYFTIGHQVVPNRELKEHINPWNEFINNKEPL